MVNWSKRPEFSSDHIPKWRKRLDVVLLGAALLMTAYNGIYVGLGLYFGEIDHAEQRRNIRVLDDKIHKSLYGKTFDELSPTYQALHRSVSIVELAANIRESQLTRDPNSSESTAAAPESNATAHTNDVQTGKQ